MGGQSTLQKWTLYVGHMTQQGTDYATKAAQQQDPTTIYEKLHTKIYCEKECPHFCCLESPKTCCVKVVGCVRREQI